MNARRLRLAGVTALLIGTGILSATAARRDRSPVSEDVWVAPVANPGGDSLARPLDSLAAIVVARNPFRPERSPSPVEYDPGQPGAPEDVPVPAPARPTFALRGIVQAEHPRAVIEGFPGTTQAVAVHIGQQFGDFTVDDITMDAVIIRGADTTWMLKVEVPW